MNVTATDTKRCAACRIYKPLDAFSPHPDGVQGRQSQCKPCRNRERRQRYRQNKRQRELDRAQRTAYAAAAAELRERHRDEFDELYEAARHRQGLP